MFDASLQGHLSAPILCNLSQTFSPAYDQMSLEKKVSCLEIGSYYIAQRFLELAL